jgi:hypothetical protein
MQNASDAERTDIRDALNDGEACLNAASTIDGADACYITVHRSVLTIQRKYANAPATTKAEQERQRALRETLDHLAGGIIIRLPFGGSTFTLKP